MCSKSNVANKLTLLALIQLAVSAEKAAIQCLTLYDRRKYFLLPYVKYNTKK